jgi:UDP-N-acetylglucosamine--N-acetylmuramyl-(pentapeptide) pyrophosphoryl-undecaprenol N-acetylglucosamine transferase
MTNLKVLISGGGTAGHINPGIAIAKYIQHRDQNAEIIFVGTQNGLEKDLIPREGFPLKFIRVKGFRRKISLDTFLTIKELFIGLKEAKEILKAFQPDVVIGTGGYVCGPVLFIAAKMKIPTIIHEQNAFPGVTNKILSRFVDGVAISFQNSTKYFKRSKNVILTGNPIRQELLEVGKKRVKLASNISFKKPLVVVFGGSRGAKKINETMVGILKEYYKGEFRVLFATGENAYNQVAESLNHQEHRDVEVVSYIYHMDQVLEEAALVVARSGAITVSELAALGVPAILIPSPHVTANHQEYNARVLGDLGGGEILLEKDLTPEVLYDNIKSLLEDKEKLIQMSENAKKVAVSNATQRIFEIIEMVMKQKADKV